MNYQKSICQIHKEIEEKVIDFNAHVVSAGEESITDYLMWKWSLANKTLSHFSAKTFTRHEENTKSGADIELELWLIGNSCNLPLLIQSKKLSKEYKSYKAALSYPKGTRKQILKLLTYANKENKVPLYMFYSQSSEAPYWKTTDCGIFIAHADDILRFANLPKRSKLSKTEILNKSIRFHDLFCDQGNSSGYQKDLLSVVIDKLSSLNVEKKRFLEERLTENLPDYVRYILDNHMNNISLNPEGLRELFYGNEKIVRLNKIRHIAVYDTRTQLNY